MATDPNCIFCQIVAGELPANILHRDENVVAFEDIQPVAATHIVVIPTEHVEFIVDYDESQAALIGRLALAASQIAERGGLDASGYRLVINQGPDSGQMVDHLHMHLLGGEQLAGLGG
ncbi:MAG: histidine triad nucleotide-binding protein [Chloroflexi bacterium]|nr:histidine triad nucleotide-binding protein [Chloroflexota bacterium]